MLHWQHLHEWLYLGPVHAKQVCQSTKGTQSNRHRIKMASVGTWYDGSSSGNKEEQVTGMRDLKCGSSWWRKKIENKGRGKVMGKDVMKTSLQRKINSKKENSLYLSLKCPVHTGNDLFLMNWITCVSLMMLSWKLLVSLGLEVKFYQWRMINDY